MSAGSNYCVDRGCCGGGCAVAASDFLWIGLTPTLALASSSDERVELEDEFRNR
jgi:hypothetical protein